MEDISICMPIYYKESAETIRRCFDSLMKQTILPKQIVCALDDPSEPEVEECLKEIKEMIEQVYGKAKESVDISNPDGSMTPTVRIIDSRISSGE